MHLKQTQHHQTIISLLPEIWAQFWAVRKWWPKKLIKPVIINATHFLYFILHTYYIYYYHILLHIFLLPLHLTRHPSTTPGMSNPHLRGLFVNQYQMLSQTHHSSILFIVPPSSLIQRFRQCPQTIRSLL